MLKRVASTLVLAILAVGFVAGCQNDQKVTKEASKHSMSEPVAVKGKVAGSNAKLSEAGAKVINSKADLDAIGVEEIIALNPDFENESVVILSAGDVPTGGYSVDITGIQEVGDTLYVQGVINEPAEDTVVTQVIEYPYASAVIEKVEPAKVVAEDVSK